jgi:hypothetical protein
VDFLAVDFLAVDFLPVDFLPVDFLAVDFLAVDFLAVDFLAPLFRVFRAVDLLALVFLEVDLFALDFGALDFLAEARFGERPPARAARAFTFSATTSAWPTAAASTPSTTMPTTSWAVSVARTFLPMRLPAFAISFVFIATPLISRVSALPACHSAQPNDAGQAARGPAGSAWIIRTSARAKRAQKKRSTTAMAHRDSVCWATPDATRD